MVIIGIIVIGIILFVVLGLLGWVFKFFGFGIDFLSEGISSLWGCLCRFIGWIIMAIFLIYIIISLL